MEVAAPTNPQGVEAQQSPEDRLARMFGEGAQEANPEPDTEDGAAEEVEAEATEPEAEEGQSETEAETTTEPEETADLEIDGEVYAVPKKLEQAFLRQKDYTQKTQEVAEKRRVVDERERFIGELENFRAAVFEKAVEAKAIESRLAQFEGLDWNALAESGSAEYLKLDRMYRELQQQQSRVGQEIQGIIQSEQQKRSEYSEKQRQTALAEAAKTIPGWNEGLQKAVLEDTKTYGFTEQELAEVNDPRYLRVLHDAKQWRDLQKSKNTIVKKKVDAAKPITVKSARSAQANQSAGLVEAARARLKKTGSAKDAEEALYQRLIRKR